MVNDVQRAEQHGGAVAVIFASCDTKVCERDALTRVLVERVDALGPEAAITPPMQARRARRECLALHPARDNALAKALPRGEGFWRRTFRRLLCRRAPGESTS